MSMPELETVLMTRRCKLHGVYLAETDRCGQCVQQWEQLPKPVKVQLRRYKLADGTTLAVVENPP